MNLLYNSSPADIFAAIGPSIGACCFETDADVPDAMRSALGSDADAYIAAQGEKWYVDLAGLNRLWLLRAGIPAEQIMLSGLCTACEPDLFWSHRKMGTARGLQAAVITCRR
jgi:copper oxidase (laccase) domain-containing protein